MGILNRFIYNISYFLTKFYTPSNRLEVYPKSLNSTNYNFGKKIVEGDLTNWAASLESAEANKKYQSRPHNLYSFDWLFFIADFKSMGAKTFTKELVNQTDFTSNKFCPIIWDTETAALRLLAQCSNLLFLSSKDIYTSKIKLKKNIYFHYKFLTLQRLFFYRGLKNLRINSAILFSYLILENKLRTRRVLLNNVSKNLQVMFGKRAFSNFRNPEELLEIMWLINRIRKNLSTSDLSQNDSLKTFDRIQNLIAPILRGLRLGNGSFISYDGSNGGLQKFNIDKELCDSNLKNFSICYQPLGFVRFSAGRIKLIFNKCDKIVKSGSSKFFCPTFSFEVTSSQRHIFQNNTAFNTFFGNTENISGLQSEYNGVRFFVRKAFSHNSSWKSEIIKEDESTDLNQNIILGEKIVEYGKHYYNYKRKITINRDGNEIFGFDLVSKQNMGMDSKVGFRLEFYHHPDVKIWDAEKSGYFLLQLKNNEVWRLESDCEFGFLEKYYFLDPLSLLKKVSYRICFDCDDSFNELSVRWRLKLLSFSKRITREKQI